MCCLIVYGERSAPYRSLAVPPLFRVKWPSKFIAGGVLSRVLSRVLYGIYVHSMCLAYSDMPTLQGRKEKENETQYGFFNPAYMWRGGLALSVGDGTVDGVARA